MTLISVRDREDVDSARRAVTELGLELGMTRSSIDDLAVVVTELASNLLRHARDGTLTFEPVAVGERDAVEIVASDAGPGIGNIGQAMGEGYSTRGSMGSGLGAVRRLADTFEIESSPDGTRIKVQKWLKRPNRS